MLDKIIIEEMAKLDGYVDCSITHKVAGRIVQYGRKSAPASDHERRYEVPLPAYLTSHDAVQRVIGKLDYDTLMQVTWAIQVSTTKGNHSPIRSDLDIGLLTATPRQKCEAILRATGRWEKDGN